MMQNLEVLCREGDGPVLFDMDGTLFAGDLGETSFFLLLASELLHKEPEAVSSSDIASLEQVKGTQAAQVLGSYSKAIKQGQLARAYAITSDYVQTLPYTKVLRACTRSFEAFCTDCSFWFDGVEHRLFVRKEEHMLTILRTCLEAKRAVFLVSASPLAVVQAFCELFSLRGITLLAADAEHAPPYGRGKRERLAGELVHSAHLAFGNSIGDVEMLQMACYGILRNPGLDEQLRSLAKEHAWLLID
jgi:phosphoserine phosphatase